MYYISDPTAQHVSTYGNVIFSKTKLNECGVKKLETKCGRKCQVGTIKLDKPHQLALGTFHLESGTTDREIRQKQLQQLAQVFQNQSCAIICGDTNFYTEDEVSGLGNLFKDAWKELYQKTEEEAIQNPGITFDTKNNIMCREEFLERADFLEKQLRLDRCFYTPGTIEPLSMEILGVKPYFKSEWISDHYGIVLRLKLK